MSELVLQVEYLPSEVFVLLLVFSLLLLETVVHLLLDRLFDLNPCVH
jgi:hypothetical protein